MRRVRDAQEVERGVEKIPRCPFCFGNIRTSFVRAGGPVDGTHARVSGRALRSSGGGDRCRVVVLADPEGGWLVARVPDDRTVESVLSEWAQRWVGAAEGTNDGRV